VKLLICLLFISCNVAAIGLSPKPNSTFTPGAVTPKVTQENIKNTICVPYYTTTVRPSSSYTSALKVRQLATYYAYSSILTDLYEEDHRVPLTLGGDPKAESNLWPQPRLITWGANRKDQLEVFLKKRVCDGTVTLKEAQKAFLGDWVYYYKKYKLVPSKQSKLVSTENLNE
jgi:hypothetical protein